MSILLIVINTIGTHIMSVKLGHTSEIFYDYLSPTVVIYSICVFILTKTYIINNNYNFSNQFRKIITLMSKYSLAIYMFHVFILILIQKFGINPSICNPLISIPIITIVIYIISFLTIHLCSKISYFKKYMM